jgi:MORN repeat
VAHKRRATVCDPLCSGTFFAAIVIAKNRRTLISTSVLSHFHLKMPVDNGVYASAASQNLAASATVRERTNRYSYDENFICRRRRFLPESIKEMPMPSQTYASRVALFACALWIAAPASATDTTTADGARYSGAIIDGMRHGQGRLAWPNGASYEGDFLNGLFHGRGKSWA